MADRAVQPMEGSSWGWSFLLGVGLVAGAYMGAGAYIGRHSGSEKGARAALERHPHRTKWLELASLVSDGVSYSRAYVQRRGAGGGGAASVGSSRAGYQAVPEPPSNGKSKDPKSKKSSMKSGGADAPAPASSLPGKREKASRQAEDYTEPGAAAAGGGGPPDHKGAALAEQAVVAPNLHQSQAKIKVVGING